MKKAVSFITIIALAAALVCGAPASAHAADEMPQPEFESTELIPDGVCADAGCVYVRSGDTYDIYDLYGGFIGGGFDSVDSSGGYIIIGLDGLEGIMNANGLTLVDPEYDHIEIAGDWAVCSMLAEPGEKAELSLDGDSDDSESSGDVYVGGGKYMNYADITVINLKNPAIRGSFTRDDYYLAQDLSGVLYIISRSWSVSYYDEALNPLTEAEAYELMADLRGYKLILSGEDDSLQGIADADGRTIIEPIYDSVIRGHGSEEQLVDGYFAAELDDVLYFFDYNGGKLAEFETEPDCYIDFFGDCAVVNGENYTVYHADGTVTVFGEALGSLTETVCGGELYLKGENNDGDDVLYDSYGSPVLEAYIIHVFGDGHAAAITKGEDGTKTFAVYSLG